MTMHQSTTQSGICSRQSLGATFAEYRPGGAFRFVLHDGASAVGTLKMRRDDAVRIAAQIIELAYGPGMSEQECSFLHRIVDKAERAAAR